MLPDTDRDLAKGGEPKANVLVKKLRPRAKQTDAIQARHMRSLVAKYVVTLTRVLEAKPVTTERS